MTSHKISVLGAGNAGYTISFHLAQKGHQVMLFEHPDFASAVEPVQKSGGIIKALAEEGGFQAVISGEAKLVGASTDIKQVVEFADVLILIVPAFGQVPIFQQTLPYLRDGQIFILMPGNFASLDFARIMKENKVNKKVYFAECETIPYGCRRVRDNEIFVNGLKKQMVLGVLPGNKTDEVFEKVKSLVPVEDLRKAPSVIAAAFSNMNMIIHPPPSLFNAGWVESRGGSDFSFYRDAISPSVAKYIQRIDEERLEVAKACGLNLGTCVEIFCNWYGMPITDYYRCFHESPYHGFFTGPASMDNRYVTEDLGYLLLPIAKYLAPKFGIQTPAIDSLATIAGTFLGREIVPQRDLSRLVKKGESLEKLQERLQTGVFD